MLQPTPGGSGREPEKPRPTMYAYQENSSTLAAISGLARLWMDRMRRRRALRNLAERNDYLLADVGLTQEQALREANKPFWRV